MTTLEELEALPAYIYQEDEQYRLYLMITRDIRGHWDICYETEGRCYYPTTAPELKDCVWLMAERLKDADDAGIDLASTDPEAT